MPTETKRETREVQPLVETGLVEPEPPENPGSTYVCPACGTSEAMELEALYTEEQRHQASLPGGQKADPGLRQQAYDTAQVLAKRRACNSVLHLDPAQRPKPPQERPVIDNTLPQPPPVIDNTLPETPEPKEGAARAAKQREDEEAREKQQQHLREARLKQDEEIAKRKEAERKEAERKEESRGKPAK